jgi:catechol 2,3-dioxygenase-like lactoylglutathione lyase family enzyme
MKGKVGIMERKGMTLPPVSQIGVVVRDLKKAMEYYSRVFGIGPFQEFVFAPEKHWLRGRPMPIKLNIAMAQMGPVLLELIEPVEGDAPHRWFLEKKGEGLQHLGFFVDNYDEWKEYCKEQGIEVLMEAETYVEGLGQVRGAYMESDNPGGILFEFIEIKPPQSA